MDNFNKLIIFLIAIIICVSYKGPVKEVQASEKRFEITCEQSHHGFKVCIVRDTKTEDSVMVIKATNIADDGHVAVTLMPRNPHR